MLDGWYCRTLASEQAAQQNDVEPNMSRNYETDSDSQDHEETRREHSNAAIDYKSQYRYLKRKLKYLIYENEFFQDALRSNQRRLLKASRDRAFLLDRLLQYEKPENTSSDSDETEESSEDEATKELKRRKLEQSANGTPVAAPRGRKKKAAAASVSDAVYIKASPQIPKAEPTDENQQTQAEVERQLLKRSVIDLIPESAPAMVPAEMFSNEHSLDSQANDHLIEVSSPTHVAAEECVSMEHSN